MISDCCCVTSLLLDIDDDWGCIFVAVVLADCGGMFDAGSGSNPTSVLISSVTTVPFPVSTFSVGMVVVAEERAGVGVSVSILVTSLLFLEDVLSLLLTTGNTPSLEFLAVVSSFLLLVSGTLSMSISSLF